jgi:hypothetical protein
VEGFDALLFVVESSELDFLSIDATPGGDRYTWRTKTQHKDTDNFLVTAVNHKHQF